MQSPTILVVEDEIPIQNIIVSYLRAERYTVYTACDGASALAQMWAIRPALVVLDIILPGMDGFEVCRRIRQDFETYIIFLTARSEEVDKLIGLSIGADDYLTKPFSPRELVARVKSILRRSRPPDPRPPHAGQIVRPALRFREFLIDPVERTVWRAGIAVSLTPRESDLLYRLAEQAGRACSRSWLLERIWGRDFAGIERVVDVHIKQLRRKLEDDPANPTIIQTVRGSGYCLMATPLE
ncbi:MAG: response regulator transcription factor [Oscillochloris sp.]|nr:response regulator transcription factor [Oscillochloris sp.]